jgi:hypothetical protein
MLWRTLAVYREVTGLPIEASAAPKAIVEGRP